MTTLKPSTTLKLSMCEEKDVPSFLSTLFSMNQSFCIDFSVSPFMIPFAILSLLIWIKTLQKHGNEIWVKNYKKCIYWQRMDFFKMVNIPINEHFQRKPGKGRFIPITLIKETTIQTGDFAEMFASNVAPDQASLDSPEQTGVYDYMCYAVSELVNNVLQHSRGQGFCFAQKYPRENKIRLAIADNGIGIKESLKDSPHYRDTDLGAIQKAIEPNVSGRAWKTVGTSENAGVGLSLLVEIAKITRGDYFILSGNALCSSQGNCQFNSSIQGTVCGFTFPIESVANKIFNNSILQDAKMKLNLLKNDDEKIFSEVFQ